MGAAGSPYAAFQRALAARDAAAALAEAKSLPKLNLPDSLELLVLIAEREPRLYERAAVRLAGRFLLERKGVTLAEGLLALALLAHLGRGGGGADALLRGLMTGRWRV